MPAKYITLPNSKQAVFDVEYKQGKKIESARPVNEFHWLGVYKYHTLTVKPAP